MNTKSAPNLPKTAPKWIQIKKILNQPCNTKKLNQTTDRTRKKFNFQYQWQSSCKRFSASFNKIFQGQNCIKFEHLNMMSILFPQKLRKKKLLRRNRRGPDLSNCVKTVKHPNNINHFSLSYFFNYKKSVGFFFHKEDFYFLKFDFVIRKLSVHLNDWWVIDFFLELGVLKTQIDFHEFLFHIDVILEWLPKTYKVRFKLIEVFSLFSRGIYHE